MNGLVDGPAPGGPVGWMSQPGPVGSLSQPASGGGTPFGGFGSPFSSPFGGFGFGAPQQTFNYTQQTPYPTEQFDSLAGAIQSLQSTMDRSGGFNPFMGGYNPMMMGGYGGGGLYNNAMPWGGGGRQGFSAQQMNPMNNPYLFGGYDGYGGYGY